MFERRRAKADERVRAAMEPRLRPGENVRTSAMGMSRVPLWPTALWVVLVVVAAYLVGLGDWTRIIAAACVFVLSGRYVRAHYLVLTDRRLLVLRCRPAWSKVVSDEWEARRGPGTPTYRAGALYALVTLDLERGPVTLQVQWAWADRARALVKEASAVPAPD